MKVDGVRSETFSRPYEMPRHGTPLRALSTPFPRTWAPESAPHLPGLASAGTAAALSANVWAGMIDGLSRQMRADGEERSDHVHYGGAAATDRLFVALGVGPQAHILDLCSGEGGPARHLAEAHPTLRLTCVELDSGNVTRANAVNLARGLAPSITTLATSAEVLRAIADKSIDGIIGLDPDAFAYADRARMCAELHRVLKPGGKLVFQHWALSPGSPRTLSREFDRFCAWGTTVPRGVNADAYAAALRGAGFDVKIVDVRERYADDQVRFVSNLLRDHNATMSAQRVEAMFAQARQSGVLPLELSRLRDNAHLDWPIGMLDFAAKHGIGVEIHATKLP